MKMNVIDMKSYNLISNWIKFRGTYINARSPNQHAIEIPHKSIENHVIHINNQNSYIIEWINQVIIII